MNKLTLQGVQDFALTTDALAFMQSAFESFEQFGNLGGENIIVSGCVVTGSSVSSGWMFLKGKLMPFVGGSIQTNVRIVETVQTVTVDVASRQQTTCSAEFGTSSDPEKNVAWSSIVSLYTLKSIKSLIDSKFGQSAINLSLYSAGYSLGTYGYAYLLVNNKVVTLYYYVTCESPGSDVLIQIPESYRPQNTLSPLPYELINPSPDVYYGWITASGFLQLGTVHSSGYVRGHATWIIQ